MTGNILRRISGRLRQANLDRHIPILLLAIVIGVLGGYGAVLFRFVILGVQYVFYQHTGEMLDYVMHLPGWQIVAMPAVGGILVGYVVSRWAKEAKGHGVPEVMEAVALRDGLIRKRVAFVKILASAVCIGSGGSVGREGPIVQIGSGIGSTVGQFFRATRPQQKTLVGCGAAAGIAATFNAPIAGALFALEVLLGDFGLTAFSPVVLSSVTATTISRHYFGDFPAFFVPPYQLQSLWEFLIYPFMGVAAGLVAILFIVVLYKAEDLFDQVRLPEWLKAGFGGLVLGVMLLKFPHVFGVGYGAINLSLTNHMGWELLLALVFIKVAATSLTIGSGGSGGIFAPSLFIGAMLGGAFGHAANALFPAATASPGAYALVAMGALVAGTTHAPITAILIIFEMTGDYKIILPLMMACILACLTASSLKRGSIYTIKLLRRGVDIAGGVEQNILRTLKVGQFMDEEVETLAEGASLDEIIHAFKNRDASYLHVVNHDGELTGIISFRDIRTILDEEALRALVVAKDVATARVVTVTPSDSIQVALSHMSDRGVSQLPVVSRDDRRRLLGTLRHKDVMAAYDRAVLRREMEASAG